MQFSFSNSVVNFRAINKHTQSIRLPAPSPAPHNDIRPPPNAPGFFVGVYNSLGESHSTAKKMVQLCGT